MAVLFGVLSFALVALLGASGVSAQGETDVVCMSSFDWSLNSKGQNPCLVAAWLQAECNTGSFTINHLPEGYHYIGPTNDTSTQNPCICSTPIYELVSACGACQNRTWISWTAWKGNCPLSMLASPGTYPGQIPSDTAVPHWAYVSPSETGDRFNVSVAKLAGDLPESSQVSSTPSSTSTSTSSTTAYGYPTTTSTSSRGNTVTVTTSSTAPPTSSSGGGGKSSTNVGAIAGGVAGGVIGIALISFLVFLLLRNKKPKNGADAGGADGGAGPGAGTYDPAAAGAAAGAYKPTPEMGQYSVASPTSPVPGSSQLPYAQSHSTGHTGAPYQATIASGGYYNPSDPHPTPVPQAYPTPQAPYNEPYNPPGGYSGMPEV